MPEEPQIKLMTYKRRQRFFLVLCVIFVFLLPAMIFYTTGHRIDLNDSENRIVTTGGMYVTTANLDVDVYLDDEQVRRPRLFRSAYYIQDVESGIHRIVVQQDGLNTWVKDLPVDPYLVVEAAAFNMPEVPQLRLVGEYENSAGQIVYPSSASSSELFAVATTTQSVVFATTTATSTYTGNPEFTFVDTLFSTSSATSTSLLDRLFAGAERFGFATTTDTEATSTVQVIKNGDTIILEREGELYAQWVGGDSSIPYYFCVANTATSSIADRYGDHVAEQVSEQLLSTTTTIYQDENRICRNEIKIDRKRQDVLFYDFLPGSSDLILMQLEDGLYVSEIDDRSWQNTQTLFPGTDLKVIVENDTIYISFDGLYAEILTEIPE